MGVDSRPGGSADGQAPPPSRRRQRFDTALSAASVDKKAVAELAWSGVPEGLSRCEIWQLLLGYRPLAQERRAEALHRKRDEYRELRRNLYDASPAVLAEGETASGRSPDADGGGDGGEAALLKQIRKDLPRTHLRIGGTSAASGTGASAAAGARPAGSAIPLVESAAFQGLLERVLFVWAVRQPASGYVQGINDVVLPLIVVCLMDETGADVGRLDADILRNISEERMEEIEADCYWCLTKILSEIFDHYTEGQPGVQRMVHRLKEIIRRIDAPLSAHLEAQNLDLMPTALRWITCLMVRDLPMACCLRLWDALIAESAQAAGQRPVATGRSDCCGSAGFEELLVYFCACFTAYFSQRLQAMDFEGMTFFLMAVPTDSFADKEVEVLLGEAYVLKCLFQQAPRHLEGPSGAQGI